MALMIRSGDSWLRERNSAVRADSRVIWQENAAITEAAYGNPAEACFPPLTAHESPTTRHRSTM
jgi:hypothetical protein